MDRRRCGSNYWHLPTFHIVSTQRPLPLQTPRIELLRAGQRGLLWIYTRYQLDLIWWALIILSLSRPPQIFNLIIAHLFLPHHLQCTIDNDSTAKKAMGNLVHSDGPRLVKMLGVPDHSRMDSIHMGLVTVCVQRIFLWQSLQSRR